LLRPRLPWAGPRTADSGRDAQSKADPQAARRRQRAGRESIRAVERLRHTLVVGEVTLAVVVLVGVPLLVRKASSRCRGR
jgi:hypothetical protein